MQPIFHDGFTLRLATNADCAGVSNLIDSVYREYGDSLAINDADSDLLDLESNYSAKGGCFVVLVSPAHDIVASHAVMPLEGGVGNFRRLYLIPQLRGGDWGNILMNWAIAAARALQIRKVEFWSDSRFHRAHKYFERFGFRHDGRVRSMEDGNMPYSEKYFCVDVSQATFVEPLIAGAGK